MSGTLYDQIGMGYDETRKADPRITSELVRHLHLTSGDAFYLDLACGTGNYTAALAQRGGMWFGLDESETMLRRACKKYADAFWQCGDVLHLPYRLGTFRGVVCVLAIHHFSLLPVVFQEVERVLSADGRLVLFTSTREQMQHYWLWEYFPEAMEKSVQQMPALESITDAIRGAGLRIAAVAEYAVQPDLLDLFLYCGKHKPELYLDERIRSGISTFASLANPSEVEQGVNKLRSDIASQRIREVQAGFETIGGDYLFLIAEKCD